MGKLKRIEDLVLGTIVSYNADGAATVIYDASAGIDNRASTDDENWLAVMRVKERLSRASNS